MQEHSAAAIEDKVTRQYKENYKGLEKYYE